MGTGEVLGTATLDLHHATTPRRPDRLFLVPSSRQMKKPRKCPGLGASLSLACASKKPAPAEV